MLSPIHALAQRGPRGGGHGGNPVPRSDIPPSTDFERQVALQPTANQLTLFYSLSKSIDTARGRLHSFEKLTSATTIPPDIHLLVLGLQDMVEKVHDDFDVFVGSLSGLQKSKYKALTRKLEKSGAEVLRQEDLLNLELEKTEIDAPKLEKAATAMERAMAELRGDQLRLGDQMGIPVSQP